MKYSNILEFLIFIYSDIAIFYMFYSIPLCADFYTNFIKGFPGYRDIIGKKKKKKRIISQVLIKIPVVEYKLKSNNP